MLGEPLEVTLAVTGALERLAVPYLLGGSIASSLLGIPRMTQDADLVADLEARHAAPLGAALAQSFYVDVDMILDAVKRHACFNVIHNATMFKVDVFVLKHDAMSREEMVRRQRYALPDGSELWVASAEDVVLQKLSWYRLGGGISERQWRDAAGVLKVQADRIDDAYIARWAPVLGVADLWALLQAEAMKPGLP